MISPMPFWPSFDPWKKLTPVQVSISSTRIQNGGGASPTGASYSARFLITAFIKVSSRYAQTNPTIGDNSNDFPIFVACAQSTPLVPVFADISWFAMPTPIIEPIKVCELEAGNPSHHVPRFQMMAATSSAKTIAKPALLPTCKINSTGNKEMIPKATSPLDAMTPRKFQKPDHTTAICGSKVWVEITVATAFAVSWNPLTNSNPKATSKAMPSKT